VNEAAGGSLLTFMVSALNRAAEQKIDEEGERDDGEWNWWLDLISFCQHT
jgi:hypothetical protein